VTCSGYTPQFQKQLDGSLYSGLNCTCASAAMANDDDTCGKEVHTPAAIRQWTGDKSGGTTLSEVDAALNANTSTRLDVRYRYPWSEFKRRVNGGAAAILQGWYVPIRDTRFGGSETFGGNHAIHVPPFLKAMDPLADGRRAGIYRYHGEEYPEGMLETFAGRLNLGGSSYVPLGMGLVYAAFTRDNDATYKATVRPLPGATTRDYVRYFVSNGRITGHERRRTRGFQAPCTAPANILTASGAARVSLVRITEGGYSGFWISSRWSDE
jgi:hypothetical protein